MCFRKPRQLCLAHATDEKGQRGTNAVNPGDKSAANGIVPLIAGNVTGSAEIRARFGNGSVFLLYVCVCGIFERGSRELTLRLNEAIERPANLVIRRVGVLTLVLSRDLSHLLRRGH